MSFIDWLQESQQTITEQGFKRGVAESAREFHYGALRHLDHTLTNTGLNSGRNVLDESWDMLVVVDGCRRDLMTDTAPSYDFISSTDTFTSIAGGSLAWMNRTFDETRDLSNVAYVTANPFSSRALDPDRFAVVDEVWKYSWDEEVGTVRAPDVTEAAIDTLRDRQVDRCIVHYMQPHHPFVPEPLAAGINRENPTVHEKTVWEKLRDDEYDRETVVDAYRQNLEYVLDDVKLLCENIDAPRTVVTADHGNAMGEWGIYGHGDYPIGVLRQVPWCQTSASDERTLEPDVDRRNADASVNEHLRDLGYR